MNSVRMAFVCKPCNASFALKSNLERHNTSSKHAKCVACVEAQPKITEFFELETKIAAQQEVIVQLSEKVSILETANAAYVAQIAEYKQEIAEYKEETVFYKHAAEISQLKHANEISELKLAHALELLQRSEPQNQPQNQPQSQPQSQPQGQPQSKPRHTGEENLQLQIEKWFKHKRNYGETVDKETGDTKVCGIRDLAVKLIKCYTDNPDLPVGNNFTRLLDIYKEEVDSKTDNPNTLFTAYSTLLHPVFKWSEEDKAYLVYSCEPRNPKQLQRQNTTLEFFEAGIEYGNKMLGPSPAFPSTVVPTTTTSSNARLIARKEQQILELEEQIRGSAETIKGNMEESLERAITYIETTYEDEPWLWKDLIQKEKDENKKKLKYMLEHIDNSDTEAMIKDLRKEVAKLQKSS
jgi:hypothetical protein